MLRVAAPARQTVALPAQRLILRGAKLALHSFSQRAAIKEDMAAIVRAYRGEYWPLTQQLTILPGQPGSHATEVSHDTGNQRYCTGF
jgi:hypothetical protein